MADSEPVSNLVVIGSSAGGIEALATLVSTLPEKFPAPIVIAQHLDPRRISHLGEILERKSRLPVRTVEEQERLENSVIYVVPANRHVTITDHMVAVRSGGARSPRPSIDLLLRSASQIFGERLIAVILTGMGSDGAVGAHAVQEAGGAVIIQNPETARHPGMPLSIAPTEVDASANVERIGPLLHDLLTGRYTPDRPDDVELMRTLLDQLRHRSGIDFSNYKAPTIMRRLQRRLVATRMPTIGEYMRFLQQHPEEYIRLTGSFLIKVTEFFRDGDLFNYLRDAVLPQIIEASRLRNKELRFWSAGCATGEEPYSLAILIAEVLGDALTEFNVRIFATDLDTEAIAFARQGVYSANAVAGLPPSIIERYFAETNGVYEIRKHVRNLVVFGQHDLGQRAPFPRIDLILCRNVLIYFTSELQKRALQLFAFSLREGGVLVLGKSESTSPLAEHFVLENPSLRIYRRHGDPVLIPPARIWNGSPTGGVRYATAPRPPSSLESALVRVQRESRRAQFTGERADALLARLLVGVLTLNRRYDIQLINNAARNMLGIHNAAIGEDAVHLARNVSPAEFRQAIDAAFRSQPDSLVDETISGETASGERRYFQLICYPQPPPDGEGEATVMVLVTDITRAVSQRQVLEERVDRLSEEAGRQSETISRLMEMNQRLLDANRELADANTELRSANEEFLVGNEELQAATEEVETLNEELQATNEELETLNEELQATVEELNTTNDDLRARSLELQDLAVTLENQRRASDEERARLEAVLVSMGDAVLVVDPEGRPMRTNAAYDRLFGQTGLRPEDESGRPLSFEDWPQRRAARGESFSTEFTIGDSDGTRRWYEANGRPIQGSGDSSLGGVVVIRDISDRSMRRLQEQFLAVASHELRTPLTALRGYIQLLQRGLSTPADGDLSHHAQMALLQADRMRGLVDDLVDVSRSESGKLSLNREPVDLRQLAVRIVEVAQTLAQGQRIELDANDDPVIVSADAGRIEQVLLNLLTNAITYAPNTERIDVRLRRVDGSAQIEVQDYGPGIPSEAQANLFSRYYQVAQADRPQGGGLGLGLYIASEVVTAHGGTIRVRSSAGAGTTFTVHLPLLGD